MKRIILIVGIVLVLLITAFNTPAQYWSLAYWFGGQNLGALSLTDISSSDTVSNFPTTYTANNTLIESAINTIEGTTTNSTITTLSGLTTAASLSTIGTITTGSWNATAIPVNKGGTGTTSPSVWLVLLGNAANGITVASTTGTSGQVFTSNGASNYPSWQTYAIDEAGNYTWTGTHIFNKIATTTFAATSSAVSMNVTGDLMGNFSRLIVATTTDTIAGKANNATTTLFTFTIPPNSLFAASKNGKVAVQLDLGTGHLERDVKVGFYVTLTIGSSSYYAFATTTGTNASPDWSSGTMWFDIYGDGASAQEITSRMNLNDAVLTSITIPDVLFTTTTQALMTEDNTQPLTVKVEMWGSSISASLVRVKSATAYLLR